MIQSIRSPHGMIEPPLECECSLFVISNACSSGGRCCTVCCGTQKTPVLPKVAQEGHPLDIRAFLGLLTEITAPFATAGARGRVTALKSGIFVNSSLLNRHTYCVILSALPQLQDSITEKWKGEDSLVKWSLGFVLAARRMFPMVATYNHVHN